MPVNDNQLEYKSVGFECENCGTRIQIHEKMEPIFKIMKEELIRRRPEEWENANNVRNQESVKCLVCNKEYSKEKYTTIINNKRFTNSSDSPPNYGSISPVVVINIVGNKNDSIHVNKKLSNDGGINKKLSNDGGINNQAFQQDEGLLELNVIPESPETQMDENENSLKVGKNEIVSIPEKWRKSSRVSLSSVSSIRKRSSTRGTPARRESIKNMIFGNADFGRRFSQDLSVKNEKDSETETLKVIFLQVFVPFLMAGFGNVGAGLILDYVQYWDVFQSVTELFILVASFLGFKGNLEMTLAARLSTQANLGNLDKTEEQWKMGIGNVLLIQCQAIVVAFLAAVIAVSVNIIKEWNIEIDHVLLICATSLITASVTGFFLASLMIVVIIISRKVGVNPDNCSTLIAAFLGDITAVVMLSGTAKLLFMVKDIMWISALIICGFFAALPFFIIMTKRNQYTRDVVYKGWWPIIIAMVISSVGGFIFDFAVGIFQTIAIFQPIINGVGSNLVAVQASRISTYLHQRCSLGEEPPDYCKISTNLCQSPHAAFFGSNANVRTARLLLLMAIPGHIIYIITIKLVKLNEVSLTAPFILSYLLVALVQVAILLFIAHILVPFLWTKKIDPDNSAIPGIMATGDLIGTALLTVAYLLLVNVGDPNASNKE